MGRRGVIGGVLAAALVAVPGAAHASATPPGCHPEWPVVAHEGGGRVVPAPAGSPAVVACATETGYATSESTIGVTRNGVIVYSPALTENSLARSLDLGATWSLSYPPDEQYTSLFNTDDPYLTVDRRTGRVFWSHATGPTRTTPVVVSNSPLPNGLPTAVAAASGFQVYTSADDGRTFSTADYSTAPTGDWEKVFVGPPPAASTGAPQPTGYPDVVYLCANAPFEVSGPGRLCYRSLDGGTTFSPAGFVFPSPAMPPDVCPALATNNAVVDGAGTIYHPVSCQHAAYVATSRDEGTSYTWVQVPGAPPASGTSGSLQLAVDDSGVLYALWQRGDEILLAVSHDQGRSFAAPLAVTAPGVHGVALPVLAAGARGEVGITYYASPDPAAKALDAYITQTRDALAARPLFYSAAINDPAHPIFANLGFNGSPRADYVGGAYDATGTFFAGVVKQLSGPDANGRVATTGYVGRLAFATAPPATHAAPAPRAKPRSRGCVAAALTLRVDRLAHGRVVRAVAYVNGRRVTTRRAHRLHRLVVTHPRRGAFRVRIVVTTSRGVHATSTRTYRGCTRTRRAKRRPRFTG